MSRGEPESVEAHVARVEAATGVQIVVALVDKADTYLELPWRAFALGASLGAFGAVLVDALSPAWWSQRPVITAAAALALGAALALLAIVAPSFGRLFLRDVRRNAEVRHCAESMFLRRELFATHARTGVLVLVAKFERKVEILPDVGLRGRVTSAEWSRIIAAMTPALRERRYAAALREALDAIEELLVAKGFTPGGGAPNELPDRPITSRGVRE